MASAHPGFKNVAAGIARRQGVPIEQARAELASATRKAGKKARAANPRLNRVNGGNKY